MSNVTLSVWKKKLEMQVKHFFHQGTNCKLSMKIRNRLPHLVFFMPKIPFPGAWPQFRTMVPIWFSHRCGVCAVCIFSLQYLSKDLFCAFSHQVLFSFSVPYFPSDHLPTVQEASPEDRRAGFSFSNVAIFLFFEPGWLFKFSFELMVLVNRNASLRLWGTIQGFLKNKNFNDHLINCYIYSV